jgi:hypothetical protein
LLEKLPDFSRVDLVLIGYWIAILVLFASMIHQFRQLRYAQELDQEGISTSGIINDCWTNQGADYTDYILTYNYLTELKADANVPSKIYHSAREGDHVKVIYLSNHPEISQLDLSSIPKRAQSPAESRPTPIWDDRDSRE